MSERKYKVVALDHGCIKLLGGLGTLEEITRDVSSSFRQNDSPCVFYNINSIYQPMENMHNDMVDNIFNFNR